MITVTILGNNSAIPAHGRHPTAQVISIQEQLFLMDCGEGTQEQMSRYHIHRGCINYIFISHLHGDHYFGLIGLLSSLALWGRTKAIHLYGPILLKEILELQFKAARLALSYPLHYHAIKENDEGVLIEEQHFSVRCFPVHHGLPCHGFIFTEKNEQRIINPVACQEQRIPKHFYNRLKQGEDYLRSDGTCLKNKDLTFDPKPNLSYAFCADTVYSPDIVPYVKGVDLLYHESTFLKDNEERANKRFHSTAEQAAKIAKMAQVKQLLIGHYSSRYQDLQPFAEEAKQIFANTLVTLEGEQYSIK